MAQRERISQRKLDQQALVLTAEQLPAAVVDAGFVLDDLLITLAADASLHARDKTVSDTVGQLRCLEPVTPETRPDHAGPAPAKRDQPAPHVYHVCGVREERDWSHVGRDPARVASPSSTRTLCRPP